MNLKRKLLEHEEGFLHNPRGMAKMHYKDMAESINPYTLGSLECGEYIDEFQKCMKIFEPMEAF